MTTGTMSFEINKQYNALLKPYHLTYTGFITKLAIEDYEQLTVKELGSRLYLDSGTLTPLLKKLEQTGYITRERSMQDERQMNVSLTDVGRNIRQELPCISEKIASENDSFFIGSLSSILNIKEKYHYLVLISEDSSRSNIYISLKYYGGYQKYDYW